MKGQASDMKNPGRPQPRQRSRLNLILLVVFAVLLIGASIILVLTIPHTQTIPSDTQPSDTTAASLTGFDTDAVEAQQLYPFASGVAQVSHDRIAYLDLTGSEHFAADIEMAAPLVLTSGSHLLAADKDGHSYILLSPAGEICRGSTTDLLRGAALAPDGHFALITEPANSTGVVKIYEPAKGQWLFDCLFPDSGFVLSVAFTKDSRAFDVSLLNTDGSAVHPILKRLTLTGETTGQRILDDAAIYPLIVYDQAGQPVLCGNQGVVAVSYEKAEPLYRVSLPAIQTVAGAADGLLMVASESLGGRQSLLIRPSNGKQEGRIAIGDRVSDMAVNGQVAVIGTGTRVLFIDTARQSIIGEQNMAAEVIRMGFSGDRTVTVITRKGARQLTVPK